MDINFFFMVSEKFEDTKSIMCMKRKTGVDTGMKQIIRPEMKRRKEVSYLLL